MDQKKEVMMDGRVEKRRKRRRQKSKGEPEGGCQQCCSRSSEIYPFDTGAAQHKKFPVARALK